MTGDERTPEAGAYAGLGDWTPESLDVPGVVRPVVSAPDQVLSRPGGEVDPTAEETVRLAADLVATMQVSPGCVGLAAPQVGVGAQVFAVDVTGHPKALTVHGTFVLCNARVVEASRWKVAREGCMSVPDLTGDVKRASRLVVEGVLPGSGRPVRLVTDGFEARALQHEIDHCAGLLFLDRVAGAHAIYQRKVYL
ncbi:peptide deformylase [Micromonospora citrea]|uniref:Peptide deformylase n=1 Tax=Micromonospora citrea TaxID=47855 RepID=A0A1C6V8D4_9ACTN|nr:peptide deformylase [Micromonospora citrea]SCL62535.1 peptide deformylase [Micromonospora citrea]